MSTPKNYHKRWTPEEEQYICDHRETQSDAEIAQRLGRTQAAVTGARRRLHHGHNCKWTEAEDEYLADKWGESSIPTIAKNLGRTKNAIVFRANRLGLGPHLMGGDYITLNQLLIAVTDGGSYSYKMKSWVENRGLPVHTKKVNHCRFKVVYLHEFWEWAEKNRSFIDFSKMEPLALGEEPEWVRVQRSKDFNAFALQRKDPWTSEDDSRLKMLLKQHKYGYAELSEMLNRSSGAILRRCHDLNIKERPLKAATRGDAAAWTKEDFEILADGIRNGDSYTVIGRAIGKSEKAIRGKVYFDYFTENEDKVRKMLGNGPWGFGAPSPTVKRGISHSRTRKEVRQNLSVLDALLRKRINDLGYDPFWQRFMCVHWDDISGCAAQCADCDSCTEFRRIPPQYCARCGVTFYERAENRFCNNCRIARKKQAQRKWCRVERGSAQRKFP